MAVKPLTSISPIQHTPTPGVVEKPTKSIEECLEEILGTEGEPEVDKPRTSVSPVQTTPTCGIVEDPTKSIEELKSLEEMLGEVSAPVVESTEILENPTKFIQEQKNLEIDGVKLAEESLTNSSPVDNTACEIVEDPTKYTESNSGILESSTKSIQEQKNLETVTLAEEPLTDNLTPIDNTSTCGIVEDHTKSIEECKNQKDLEGASPLVEAEPVVVEMAIKYVPEPEDGFDFLSFMNQSNGGVADVNTSQCI